MSAVSVVMGVFNGANHLPETIDSVLQQSMQDFEFIIINDGSTDPQVAAILNRYSKLDNRVIIISKENQGLTKALMDGCRKAQGDVLARIDVGDVMTPDRLEKQRRVLQEFPDCSFASCHTEFYGPQWEFLWLQKGSPDSREPVSVLGSNAHSGFEADIPHHGAVMMRRPAYEAVGGYRAEFYFGQDWDLWYRLAEHGTYMVLPEALYRARLFPSSISMTQKPFQDESAHCSLQAFRARRSEQDEAPWLQRAAKARPSSLSTTLSKKRIDREPGMYFVGEALRRQGDMRCRKYFFAGIKLAPLKPRSYVRLLQTCLPRQERLPAERVQE